MEASTVYKIKDSVDLFLSNETFIMAYYMNTRQRKSFKVNDGTIHLLENIDGIHTLLELKTCMKEEFDINPEFVEKVIALMVSNHIVTEVNNNSGILSLEDQERYTRQINYFSEFLNSETDGQIAQKKIMESKVIVFGCGAVGGDIAIQLAMSGIGEILLFDFDKVEISDASRHMYFKNNTIGISKVDALANELKEINSSITVKVINKSMKPETDVEEMIKGVDFVVNTMDEPYIGYTASKISRICVKYNISHFIAGGFDAHLASTGELIIPYVTPCVECYAGHFKETLKGWKPKKHPVKKRYEEIGGLACLSLFSSSYACIEIIKCIAGLVDLEDKYKVRGEFLFHDMSLTYLNVDKNPDCPICGGGLRES